MTSVVVDLSQHMIAFFFSATVVALLQYLRLGDRRLLPLTAQFALMASAHCFAGIGAVFAALQIAAGCASLVLLYMLSPRHPAAR